MQKLELIGAFNILKNTQIVPFKMKYQINIFVEKEQLSDIIIYLGDPTDEPDYPLLSEYISEHLGYLIDSDDDLWQYWFDYFSGDEEELENKKKSGISPKELIGELDKPLHPDSGEARDWMETAYEMKESPAARMLSFLGYELEKKIELIKQARRNAGRAYAINGGNGEHAMALYSRIESMEKRWKE